MYLFMTIMKEIRIEIVEDSWIVYELGLAVIITFSTYSTSFSHYIQVI